MTKEEAYSIVLELRKIYISAYEDTYRGLKDSYDFYCNNPCESNAIYQDFMSLQDEILINAKKLFNNILKLIHEIE